MKISPPSLAFRTAVIYAFCSALSAPATTEPFAYVANGLSNDVSVIDTASNSVIATVAVGDEPQGVAIHPSGDTVYVANAGDDSVSVIDAATNTMIGNLPVEDRPSGRISRFLGSSGTLDDAQRHRLRAPSYRGNGNCDPMGT